MEKTRRQYLSLSEKVSRIADILIESELLPEEKICALRAVKDSCGALLGSLNESDGAESLPAQNFRSANILVVDDMESNLEITAGFLKLFGLKAETAMSGQEAIEKIKDAKFYDIIFLDHLMPEMDGIETAKRIRDLQKQAGGNGFSAMIALTAMEGQEDLFLKNGFDGFLQKPVNKERLHSVLAKYLCGKYPGEAAVFSAKTGKGNDNEEALRRSLKDSVCRDIKKAVSLYEQLLQNGSLETQEGLRNFTISAHGIKSSLANIGEETLSAAAASLENAGRSMDIEYIKNSAPDFFSRLRVFLEKIKPEKEPPGNSKEDENLAEKLQKILEMCADFDRKGVLDLLAGINGSRETKQVLDNIREKVLHSDFEEAQKDTASLIRGEGLIPRPLGRS